MNESGSKAKLGTADIVDILKLLPHRYPFLLVDRIIEMDGDRTAIGIKNVTVNEPYFQGHFPGNPVMPGVLLIEGMAQTAGALCMRHLEKFEEPPLVYFMAIDKARFRRPVVPGDTIHYHVQKMRNRGRVWRFRAQAHVEGQLVAEAEVSAVIVETFTRTSMANIHATAVVDPSAKLRAERRNRSILRDRTPCRARRGHRRSFARRDHGPDHPRSRVQGISLCLRRQSASRH